MTEITTVKDESFFIRGATLISRYEPCARQDTNISPVVDADLNVAEYSVDRTVWIVHFLAPSAAHLTTCFSPDSQHPRLSVEASLPLSPLQRFHLLNCVHCTTGLWNSQGEKY